MNSKINKRYYLVIFLLFFCLGGLSVILSAQQNMLGKKAPDWTLKDINGKDVNLSDFRGKVVILDFWATWCPPCRREIPGFIELQQQYEKSGLVVVGISFDKAVGTVKSFAQKLEINYPLVMGKMELAKAYGGITSIPTTFILDRTGKIVKSFVGFHAKSEFEKEIKPLLLPVKTTSN